MGRNTRNREETLGTTEKEEFEKELGSSNCNMILIKPWFALQWFDSMNGLESA